MEKRGNVVVGVAIALALAGCASNGDDLGRTGSGSTTLALMSSSGERGVLRTGETFGASTAIPGVLSPLTMYRVTLANNDSGTEISHADSVTDRDGNLALTTLLHDVGESEAFSVHPGDMLRVSVFERDAPAMPIVATIPIDILPALQIPSFNVHEIQPPHVYAADSSGTPQNAFAVGGADPGEIRGPVFVAGEGFPQSVAGRDVNVYVVSDRDEWVGRNIPTSAADGLIAGPIPASVGADGRLAPTQIFDPTRTNVGIFDILVDLDNNGRFDWSFASKDGADGLGKVGFTVQYSQAWLRELGQRHVLVNIAYGQAGRDGGVWTNTFAGDQHVFMYLNPPVMQQYHFSVTKWVVRHAGFDAFWNNPANFADDSGTVCFERDGVHMAIMSGDEPPQTGCTNTGAVCFGPMPAPMTAGGGPMAIEAYDVVFDRNGDGCYEPGVDLLDIVGGALTGGGLVTLEQFRALAPADQVGFQVVR